MLSLPGYFRHTEGKTYIDKYPPEIITLEELRGRRLVEFGAGKGNDMRFLIQSGLSPADLWYLEGDPFVFTSVYEELEDLFAPDPVNENYLDHIRLMGVVMITNYRKSRSHPLGPQMMMDHFRPGSFDYVYANNFLHCLAQPDLQELPVKLRHEAMREGILTGDIAKRYGLRVMPAEQRVRHALFQAQRLLRDGGMLFGRTQHSFVDFEKLLELEHKERNENEEFLFRTVNALLGGDLFGMTEPQLSGYAMDVGFQSCVIRRMHDPASPIGVIYFRFGK